MNRNTNTQSAASYDCLARKPESSVHSEASDLTNLQSQEWKAYLLLSIICGMFVLGHLNVRSTLEPLQASVSRMMGNPSIVR